MVSDAWGGPCLAAWALGFIGDSDDARMMFGLWEVGNLSCVVPGGGGHRWTVVAGEATARGC